MTFAASLRDAVLVARFELLRAIRTWQALAVIVLYLVATAGSTRIFVAILSEFENMIAEQLMVPKTDYPGAMLDHLVKNDEFRSMLGAMIGDDALVAHVLGWPVLAVFHLWLGLVMMPFLATFASAECISVDMRSRALRFELLRTGRLELVTGRFLGQALLVLVASLLSACATLTVGLLFMVNVHPGELFSALVVLGLRSWAYSLPFIGIGVGCSQLTASPAWARVLAIVTTSSTWVLYALSGWLSDEWEVPLVGDVVGQLLPQGWVRLLWEPGLSWLAATLVFTAMGLAALSAGYARFSRRDL